MQPPNLGSPSFIAGYKHHPDQEDIYWLCNHPESIDLIFSKDKTKAFMFDDEQIALFAINEMLIAENHPWYTAVVENFQPKNLATTFEKKSLNLIQAETKINTLLKLFNERSNSQLELYLTVNQKDNNLRGYGSGRKLGDAVANFVALLVIKGLKARCLDQHTFEVEVD